VSNWTFNELEEWDTKICQIAEKYNLDWFPITYEVCDYYEMIGHMSYHGMPSHYQHWSYGKTFERTHQMYNLGAEGLPYELIINSNPSIAYLMKQNPAYLQVLIMAHCVGHSDFFKNNRIFKNTRPDSVTSRFRNARKRIQKYTEDPHVGLKKVESLLDTLHSIRFQTERNGRKRLSKLEIKKNMIDLINSSSSSQYRNTVNKKLLRPDYDLLSFLLEYGDHFENWEKDIINIVKDESHYFIPQIKTKIINEGWASFWHFKIMNELDLPQAYHLPFLKTHNAVVRPHIGALNPYHLGFYLFNKVEKEKGLEECFLIREIHDDESALRCYLDLDDYRELNLFSYSAKKKEITIDDIADKKGWLEVRQELLKNVGVNPIPHIYVNDITDNGTLILQHDHDGRDLNLDYAEVVVDSISQLWPNNVKFYTVVEEELWEI
tara:strand:+ start:141 stop:1445 length:1305 start_codon:yes stop_codon:yes gene_type:complete